MKYQKEYWTKEYWTDKELQRGYKAGYIDEIAKQLRRYGEITYRYDHDVEEGYYKGANTHLKITHFNREWDIEMLNGEVRSLGFKY